jgi:hypothetical protein
MTHTKYNREGCEISVGIFEGKDMIFRDGNEKMLLMCNIKEWGA